MQAGEILAIDGAVIHHSPANLSGVERIAAIGAVRPSGVHMHFVRSDGGAAKGVCGRRPCGARRCIDPGDLLEPDIVDRPVVARRPYGPATLADLATSRDLAAGVAATTAAPAV